MQQSINFIFAVIHDADTGTQSFINLDKVMTMTRFRNEEGVDVTEVTFTEALNIHVKETPDEILHQVRRAEIAAKTGVDPGDLATYRARREAEARMATQRGMNGQPPRGSDDQPLSRS